MSQQENNMDNYSENPGAIPSLGSKILGVPSTTKKSKTNVNKLFYLLAGLIAFIFLVFGTLWFAKYRGEKAKTQQISKAELEKSTAAAQKNEELASTAIEKLKQELKAKQEEQIKQKEAQEAAAAEALKTAQKAAQATAQSNAAASPVPHVITPMERKLSGSVLVNYSGDALEKSAATAKATTPPNTPPVDAPNAGLGGQQNSAPEGLAARLQPTVLDSRNAGRLPNLDYLLKAGTTIPCALKNGIDTTLAGFVVCTVINDVYSANSKTLLIERGASIFGEQQSSLKQGQERVFILWTRIDNPSGTFANLDSPGTDQMGANGVPGYVDTHFWQRFGGAIMLSLVKDFSASISARQNSNSNTGPTYNNSSQASQEMAAEALRNSINIPPTLTVLPATIVHVLVARHVSFESVYTLIK